MIRQQELQTKTVLLDQRNDFCNNQFRIPKLEHGGVAHLLFDFTGKLFLNAKEKFKVKYLSYKCQYKDT